MEFREVLQKNLDKSTVALGSRQGGLLTLNIDNYPSIVITGETGTGKSVLLDQILLQMINKYTSEDLRLVLIDTTGVELNYYKDTNYRLLTAMNDLDKSQEVLMKVIEEVDRRRELIDNSNVDNIDDYNLIYDHKIPRLVVAIDDNKSLLNVADVNKMIRRIITDIEDLNIFLIICTNDMNNKFFEGKDNMLAKVLISFDTTSEEESATSAMPFSHDLLIGRFIIYKDGNYEEYHNFEFDDEIIKEVLN